MKVDQIMTRDVATCAPESPLNEAARLMWEHDCGFVPILEHDGRRLLGILTDRDVCMAAYTRNEPLSELRAAAAMSREPVACGPDDELSVASERMRTHQVRRLPVTNPAGDLLGVVSLNDLAIAAADGKDRALRQDVAITLEAICRHHRVGATTP